jgi:U3 small nucleolar RNA-associated protein 4
LAAFTAAKLAGPVAHGSKKDDRKGKGKDDFEDAVMNVDEEVGEIDVEQYRGGWDRVLEMDQNVSTNIIASEISDDGRWLVTSDLYETKPFALQKKVHLHIHSLCILFIHHLQDDGQLAVKRVKDFTSILLPHVPVQPAPAFNSTGSFTFCFTPDLSKLVLVTALSSYVLVVDLTGEIWFLLRPGMFNQYLFTFFDR